MAGRVEDYPEAQREEQRTAAASWFDDHVIDRRCPVCGVDRWVVRNVVNLPVGRGHPANTVFLCVPIICDNCGYVRFFATDTAGLDTELPREKEPDTKVEG